MLSFRVLSGGAFEQMPETGCRSVHEGIQILQQPVVLLQEGFPCGSEAHPLAVRFNEADVKAFFRRLQATPSAAIGHVDLLHGRTETLALVDRPEQPIPALAEDDMTVFFQPDFQLDLHTIKPIAQPANHRQQGFLKRIAFIAYGFPADIAGIRCSFLFVFVGNGN